MRELLAKRRLVASFKKAVPSLRGYDVLVSPLSAAKPEVAAFVDWLLAEARSKPGPKTL